MRININRIKSIIHGSLPKDMELSYISYFERINNNDQTLIVYVKYISENHDSCQFRITKDGCRYFGKPILNASTIWTDELKKEMCFGDYLPEDDQESVFAKMLPGSADTEAIRIYQSNQMRIKDKNGE